jgi:uncharacterized protein (DUF488 family)
VEQRTTDVVFTIGHSTRSLPEFIALLKEHGAALLADVRSLPRSRHVPQFNQEVLAEALPEAGIAYRHLPQLGGLRKGGRKDSPNTGWRSLGFRAYADYMASEGFGQGLAELVGLASQRRVAIMCAEGLWWRCHRMLIADALSVAGFKVTHIVAPGRLEAHRLTPFARVEECRITYPAGGEPEH